MKIDLPDLLDVEMPSAKPGIAEFYRYMNGADDAAPEVHDDLRAVREHAAEVAKRALRYVEKVDALLRHGEEP